MTLIAVLAASALFASAPRSGELISACTSTVLPASFSETQLDRDVRELVERFFQTSISHLDPQIEVTIYPPRGERFARHDGDAISALLVELGVAANRVRVIGTAEGDARYGPQPAGTLILSAGPPGDRFCGDEIRGAER